MTRQKLTEDRTALLAVVILAVSGFSIFFWSYTAASGTRAILGVVGGITLVVGSLAFGIRRLNDSS